MKIFGYGEKFGEAVVCLGRYECVHLGHREIIKRACSMAAERGVKVAVMTYDERDNVRFGRLLLNFEERTQAISALGADGVMAVDFTPEFMNTSAEDFLLGLTSSVDVRGLVCGEDFRFGRERGGDVGLLERFCFSRGIALEVVGDVTADGRRISSTLIKQLLTEGDVAGAARLLSYPYFVSGTVVEGRKEGRKLGFPTANLVWPNDRICVKNGVYATTVTVEGHTFRGITNVGAAPTFGVFRELCETHIIGFDGDIYGRRITVAFDALLREQKKFASALLLKKQLAEDVEAVIK